MAVVVVVLGRGLRQALAGSCIGAQYGVVVLQSAVQADEIQLRGGWQAVAALVEDAARRP